MFPCPASFDLPRFGRFLALGLFVAWLPSARAVSVIPPDFPELVAESTQIARVRIVEISVRWDQSAHGPVIHTYVKAETIRTLKGAGQATINLRLLGGRVGDVSMQVADMPEFEVGRTYILFIAGNNQSFCPLVGVMHGSYPLEIDAASGMERVVRGNHQPLASIEDVALPFTQAGRPAFRPNSGGGMSASEFEAAIRNEVSHGGTN
ncbi:MAG: hypothetical protein HS122_18530 [Opitutaceae bacterium]|nr:hypothetical protein [Opitutaceae bacterium]